MTAPEHVAAGARSAEPVFRRILLKLSGEALMGDREYGMDLATIDDLSSIPDRIAARWCIDERRIHLTGHSDGGTVATATAVLRLLGDDALRARLAVAARTRIETRHDPRVMLGAFHELYEAAAA